MIYRYTFVDYLYIKLNLVLGWYFLKVYSITSYSALNLFKNVIVIIKKQYVS